MSFIIDWGSPLWKVLARIRFPASSLRYLQGFIAGNSGGSYSMISPLPVPFAYGEAFSKPIWTLCCDGCPLVT